VRDVAERSGGGGRRSGAGRRLVDKPSLLIWLDEAGPYLRAAEAAGLAKAVDLVVTPLGSEPADDLLARAEALLAWRPPARLAARAPRLRWMQSLTGGCEQWLGADTPAGAALTCARGTHRVQMSEHILAALFLCSKDLAGIVLDQAASRWRRRVNPTLAGATLGILGLGAIGVEVARLAAGLGMRVIGTKREPRAVPHVEHVHSPAETDRVLAAADYLLVLLPSTNETRGIIDKAALGRLKRTAWVLNFGRGGWKTCGASWTACHCCRSSIRPAATERPGKTEGMLATERRLVGSGSPRHRDHHRRDHQQPPAQVLHVTTLPGRVEANLLPAA
jgi:glyoxylate/hydroxypyruvate reductase